MASVRQPLQVDFSAEENRYHRQSLITWWDQERLAQARILVVGAGALGNELVKDLALLGVGTILVIDMDRVENSNLSRCVLFREGDQGGDKATLVAERARNLNSEINVMPVVGDVRLTIGLGLLREFDLVLGGLDNREARLYVNQACWKVNTPWIDGAIEGLLGVVRAFVPPDSACYECTMNEQDFKLIAARKACSLLTREEMVQGKVPTTATSASVIGGIQAQEAVKLLHADRLGYGFAGKGFVFNGLTHDSYVVEYTRRDECLSHDHYDLADSASFDSGRPASELLAAGQEQLGPQAVIEVEHEIIREMSCTKCGTSEAVNRPIEALRVGQGRCPSCGRDRRLELTHSIGQTDTELLSLTPRDLGLPRFDIVTARSGQRRKHFVLDGDQDQMQHFATHAR
jgi:molybdopterin/thiamine biosynthesis adenylyltransferase